MAGRKKAAPKPKARPAPSQTIVDACQCDACSCELGVGAAQSDGYCAFCAVTCFPAAETTTGYTRVAFTHDSRVALHAKAQAAHDASMSRQVSGDPRQALLEQAAEAAGQIVMPHVDRLLQQSAAAVQKRLRKMLG